MKDLLKGLPKKERIFVKTLAEKIKAKSSDNLLHSVSNLFDGKRFGCAESIHQRRFPRPPSQVLEGQQRFCSEEAMKDTLLLAALDIPHLHLTSDAFNNTGSSHAFVVVRESEGFTMLDYGTPTPVRFQGRKLIRTSDNRILSPRVNLRNSSYLLSLLSENEGPVLERSTGVMSLDRINTPNGNINASMSSNSRELTFDYMVRDVTTSIPFYYQQRIGKNQVSEECGIALDQGRPSYTRFPLFVASPVKSLTTKTHESLDPSTLRDLTLGVMYNILLESSDNGFLHSPEERTHFIAGLESKSRETLDYINLLRETNGEETAERYTDSLLARTELFRAHKSNLPKSFKRISSLPYPKGLYAEFARTNLTTLNENYFSTAIGAEQLLANEFSGKNRNPIPKKLLELV